MQAAEVIKIVTGIGTPLISKLLILDTLSFTMRTLNIRKNPDVHIHQLIDYEEFCGIQKMETTVKNMSHDVLKQMIKNKADFILIDVRTYEEHHHKNIGGILIPQDQIIQRKDEIPKDKKVVVYCESGFRSTLVIQKLEYLYGYTQLYNLENGILHWEF